MHLASHGGDSLVIEIVGYEFPQNESDPYDSNWLQVQVTATVNGRTLDGRRSMPGYARCGGPASWFEGAARDTPAGRELEFMEPELTFELENSDASGIRLRTWFEGAVRASWAKAESIPSATCRLGSRLTPKT